MSNYTIAYLSCIGVLSLFGLIVMNAIRNNAVRLRVRKDRFKHLRNFLSVKDQKIVDKLLFDSGLPINSFQYQVLRYGFLLLWVSSAMGIYIFKGGKFPDLQIAIAFLIFLVLSPSTKQNTPFMLSLNALANGYKYKRNLELYRSLSLLKNLALSFKGNPPSSHFILEQLRKFSVSTRPIYNRVLKEWSLGNKHAACEYFAAAFDTNEAHEFANLLLKLDSIDPAELIAQLSLFQDSIKKSRETKRIKYNEIRSWIIYAISIIVLILTLFNLAIVGYFIDTLQYMQFLMN